MLKLIQPSEKLYSIAIIVITCNIVSSQYSIPPNPCPEYFSYQQDGSSIIGSIRLDPPQFNEVFQVNVTLSVAARLPSQYPGTLLLTGSKQQTFEQVQQRLPLIYNVLFPPGIPLPRLTRIRVNGRDICYGPPDRGSYVSNIELTHNFHVYKFTYPIDSNRANDIPSYYQSSSGMSYDIRPYSPIDQQRFTQPIRNQSVAQSTVPHSRIRQPQSPVQQPTFQEPPVLQPAVQQTPVQKSPVQQPIVQQPAVQQQPSIPSRQQTVTCGVPLVQSAIPLVVGGADVVRGSWPWLAAILRYTIEKQEFICGGSLVSHKAIITAAHCLIQHGTSIPTDQLVIVLGRHNRQQFYESGMEQVGVQQTFPHPDYRHGMGYDADIAVIVLQRSMVFTDFIRPICMPSAPRNIVGLKGTVAGWGTTENRQISFVPLKVEEPIVSESECIQSNNRFRGLTSSRTFCAGDRSGSGPCLGDSGSGFGIYMGGRWTLYGSVSASLTNENSGCDLDKYVIYCNVSEFLNWIQQYI